MMRGTSMKNGKGASVPRAREDEIIVKEMGDEVLVYDLKDHRAHCLNETAARVWRSCDGRKTVAEIARRLESALETPVDDRIVWLALDQLEKFNLLKPHMPKRNRRPQVSRRALILRGVTAAVLLPLIVTISAPTAFAASSPIAQAACTARHNNDPGGCGGNPCSDVSGTTCQALGNSCHCHQ
jgi:hypothetical protein